MKKLTYLTLMVFTLMSVAFSAASCSDSETYADKKKKEKNAINKFISDNEFVGQINVISESQFYAQDSITDTAKNEFVLFEDDGIYMQVITRGEGRTMPEMSKDFADSTVNKVVLCRFLEYNIETADTTLSNKWASYYWLVDKMLVNYSHRGRSYTASFTEGLMYTSYGSQVVPTGWLKPLDFVRLSRDTGEIARVRLIIPHSSGTTTASQYVYPYYYEISYQLGK